MVKLGVIGAGYWGPNLIRDFLRLDPQSVRAVCDRSNERREFVAKIYPQIRLYEDYPQLLEDKEVQAVAVVVQPAFHHEVAKAALLRGKHVFVEKPLAVTVRECKDLIQLAEDKGLVLMVGHVFEYNPAVRKVKEYFQQGTLGKVYHLYSERMDLGTVKADVNAMWNIAPHDISILLYWLQEEPLWVSAQGFSYLQRGIEDTVHMTMEFPSSINAEVHVSWLSPQKIRTTTIVGSKNMVIYDELCANGKVKLIRNELCADGFEQTRDKYTKKKGEVITPQIEGGEPLLLECAHFLECIEKGQRPLTDGLNGLRVVKVLEAAQESLKRGGTKQTLSALGGLR
ncbi:MAG TPA: Gfo/Idh/MocA family protein [Candidatus Hypogeohydataceae bacterium YC41]